MPLSVNKLSKRYSNKWALRDISFEVEGGSVIGIFGASGSGKSSLLRSIAGITKHNGGTITLNSQDITAIKAKERGITYIGGRDETGLKQLFGMFSTKKSSGEIQFDRFETAIANLGKVLLLDEPFSQMDPKLRQTCFDAIRKATKRRDRIFIFASNDFIQIADLADEVAFLSQGEISQNGTPQDIYEEPTTVEAASITGDNNLIAARRVSKNDADLPEFHTIDGGHRLFAQNVEKRKLGAINENMTIAIRPDQVTMTKGTSRPEDNLLRGVVTQIKFRGATSLIEFDAEGLKLMTREMKIVGIKVGDECMLGLPPHRIIILKN